jgi:uncharacterized protein HemY
MSKIKNTQEFMDMMNDQELSASFHYQEQEEERTALLKDLAKLQALEQVRSEYDKAVRELDIAMDNYADALTNLWKSIPKNLRNNQNLIDHFSVCGESAKAYDKAKAEAENDGSLDSVFNELQTTFQLMKDVIPADQFDNIKRVIDQKETSAYEKTLSYLKSL